MQQELFSLKVYPSQFEKRKRELIGKHKISDIFTIVISPAVARVLNIFTLPSPLNSSSSTQYRKQLFIKIHSSSHDSNSEEHLLKLYIDPALGILKSNFKPENVERELYMNEIVMRKLSFTLDTKIEIVKIGLKSEIQKLNRVVLTPYFEGGIQKALSLNKNYVKEFLTQLCFVKNGSVISIPLDVFNPDITDFIHFKLYFKYFTTDSSDWGRISMKNTNIIFDFDKLNTETLKNTNYWKGEQYQTIMSIMKHSLSIANQNINPIRSFLINGAGGNGKSSLVFNIAKDLNVNIKKLSPSSLYEKIYQEEEGVFNLEIQMKEAETLHPCLFVIDEIDILFPDDEESKDLLLLNQLISVFQNLESTPFPICLVGITSKMDRLDPFVKQKFEEIITIDVPSHEERFEMFKSLLLNTKPVTIEMDESDMKQYETVDNMLQDISYNHFHGMVQADIAMLCARCLQIANMKSLRVGRDELIINRSEIMSELKEIEPYSIRQASQTLTIPQIPKVNWEDIGGLYDVKKKLNEMIVWPLKHFESYVRMGIKPPTGLLLYGPPGNGKTLIAKAVASASSSNFISINIPDLIKAEVGESEKTLAEVFRRAKLASPCVIFFDEIQAIFGDRMDSSSGEQRLISQLILELDSLENTEFSHSNSSETKGCVIVIAATNVPHKLDPTVLRPGRIEHTVYVGPPDGEARKSIFEMSIKGMTVDSNVANNIDMFVEKTDLFYSGADISNICQRAGLNALSRTILSTTEQVDAITVADFEKALKTVTPSLNSSQLKYYEEWEVDERK